MPSLVGGGAEKALVRMLKIFNYQKYDVTLLLVSFNGIHIKDVPSQVEIKYLFKVDFIVRVLAFLNKKFDFDFFLRLKFKYKTKSYYDTAISFLDSNFTDLLFNLSPKTKKISYVHGSYLSNENYFRFFKKKKYLNRIINNRYKKLHSIFFVSNDAMHEFKSLVGNNFNNMKVVYNIFDKEDILLKSNQAVTSIDHSKFNFIAVGSLLPIKGYDFLIEAVSILVESNKSFCLHILGDGKEKNNLIKKVRDLKIDKFIKFHGYKKNPYAIMSKCDVFVMTSISEALPNVLCEAIILGKPLLITEAAGSKEVIDNGNYGVMTKRSTKEFAFEMLNFINNEQQIERYTKLSIERQKIFNNENILNHFYTII
jgi:glycosyltransferase involved in cell wall biosynthesis